MGFVDLQKKIFVRCVFQNHSQGKLWEESSLSLALVVPEIHKPMQVTRKRSKDTSVPGASLLIIQCRRVALLSALRLTYPDYDNCMGNNFVSTAQTDHGTEPLSDSM